MRVAKEVGVRLNNELDLLDEKRVYYEEENRQLNEELQTSQNKRIAVENELGRLKLEAKAANQVGNNIETTKCLGIGINFNVSTENNSSNLKSFAFNDRP
ncbi:unnamed protein product [Trichobilharzia regenti]|nr:unnamed protein product [Trichobilharzia regenti]